MNTLVRAQSVSFNDDSMLVQLSDGRVLGVPLAWFSRLLHAPPHSVPVTPSARAACIGKS